GVGLISTACVALPDRLRVRAGRVRGASRSTPEGFPSVTANLRRDHELRRNEAHRHGHPEGFRGDRASAQEATIEEGQENRHEWQPLEGKIGSVPYVTGF